MIRNWRVRDWQIVASKRDRKRTFRFSKGWNTEAPFRDYVLRELPVADLHRWESAQGRRIVKRNGEKKKSTEPFVIWTNRVKSERQTDSNAETKKEDESLVGRIVATIRLLRERGSWTDRSCQLKPRWSDAFNLTKKKKKKKEEKRRKKKEKGEKERWTSHKFARSDIVDALTFAKSVLSNLATISWGWSSTIGSIIRADDWTLTAPPCTTVKSPSTLKPLVNGLPRKRTTVVEFYEWPRWNRFQVRVYTRIVNFIFISGRFYFLFLIPDIHTHACLLGLERRNFPRRLLWNWNSKSIRLEGQRQIDPCSNYTAALPIYRRPLEWRGK